MSNWWAVSLDKKELRIERDNSKIGVFSASIFLHVFVLALFFFGLPEIPIEAEQPESVSVEMISEPEITVPPQEEEAEPQPEPEQQVDPMEEDTSEVEPPPAAPEEPVSETETEEPVTPTITTLPNIAIRPSETQLDETDNPSGIEADEDVSGAQDGSEDVKDDGLEEGITDGDTENPQPEAADNEADLAPDEDTELTSDLSVADEGDFPIVVSDKDAPIPQPRPANSSSSGARKQATSLRGGNSQYDPSFRQLLGQLPPNRQIIQLCSVEAIAQIRAERSDMTQMDGLVPFADKGGFIRGNSLDANGGAYNIGLRWFNFSFDCQVDLDRLIVTSFSYEMGDELTRDEIVKRRMPIQ